MPGFVPIAAAPYSSLAISASVINSGVVGWFPVPVGRAPVFTRADLRAQLQPKWESTVFWTDDEANHALNEALRVWNMLTGQWKKPIPIITVANQTWYVVPGTMLYGTKLTYNEATLTPSNMSDLDNLRNGWEAETTASGGDVPTTVSLWSPAGLDLFAIWPADAVGGNCILLDGIATTPVLLADTDKVDLGPEEFNAILGYALHVASFKSEDLFGRTMAFYQQFIQAAIGKNGRLKASTFFRRYLGQDLNRSKRPMEIPAVPAASSAGAA